MNFIRQREPWLFVLLALATTLPVWLAVLPPGADVPQHSAQITLALGLIRDGLWSQDLGFYLATPYLLTYLVGGLLSLVLDPVISMKLLLSLSIVGLLFASRQVLKAHGADARLSWLAVFGCYSFSYQWGFLPFNLSMVIALWLLAVARGHDQQGARSLRMGELLLILAILLTHGLTAMFMTGLFMARAMVASNWPQRLRSIATAVLLFAPTMAWNKLAQSGIPNADSGLLLGLSPHLSIYHFYQQVNVLNGADFWGWGRLTGFFPRSLGMADGLLATLFGLVLMLLPWLAGYRLSRDWSRLGVFGALCIALLLMPTYINGAVFVSERFALLFFCLYPLVLERQNGHSGKGSQAAWLIGLLAIAVIIGLHSARSLKLNHEWHDLRAVVQTLPPQQRALYINYEGQQADFLAPVFLHSGHWYTALGHGLVDPGFAATYFQPVRYLPGHMPAVNMSSRFEWLPRDMSWQAFQGDRYGAFIVHGTRADFEQHTGCRVSARASMQGGWMAITKEQMTCAAQ